MTRSGRGRGSWARGLPALGCLCFVASFVALASCDSRFDFEPLTDTDGGEEPGGRHEGYGGFGLGGMMGGFGFGNSGGFTGSAARGGTDTGTDECDGRCTDGLKCLTSSRKCVECLKNDDCHAFGLARCITSITSVPSGTNKGILNRCVQCLDKFDCGNQVCSSTYSCVSPCGDDNQSQCADELTCSTLFAYCVGCFDNTDCKDDERCLPSRVRCGACTDDDDCKNQGDARWCDPVLFECVECRTSRDCYDENHPVCNRKMHFCQ